MQNIEIERKFLIDMPDLDKLDIKKEIDIVQTYLNNGDKDSQRRVRKITEKYNTSYFYTEKIFITHTERIEREQRISLDDYKKLLSEAKKDIPPVLKKRICFDYKNQFFEMDIYSFSSEFAILELELEFLSQEIIFPDYINVIKDVSEDQRYSNASLAAENSFPDETAKKELFNGRKNNSH